MRHTSCILLGSITTEVQGGSCGEQSYTIVGSYVTYVLLTAKISNTSSYFLCSPTVVAATSREIAWPSG